ncbi:MAG: BMP family ABC transporter substrate-binding protein [Atopobiaceae bacterium]|nr:BMP family ABC transporter substrate-binding protein [Atopobiaceae bacterium]
MFDGKMTRRSFAATMGVGALAALAGCGGSGGDSGSGASSGDASVKVEMVTDTGGINDQSFNQLAWKGMQQLKADNGWEVSYIESKQDSDYVTNLDKAVDDGCAIVWGIGFAMSEAVNSAAESNPDVLFGSIEGTNETGAENLVAVAFRSQESSFAEGYIAARMSEAGKVGFVGGVTGETIQAFEYGYYAGVEYANKEQGTKVTYQGQYAESFTDAAKGKSIAQKMIKDGCDVLFHAAGGAGIGMLEACNDAGVKCIGVDQDQAIVFPDYTTIISSALKRVDQAVYKVSNGLMDGSIQGEENIVMGAADDAVGIAETHDKLPDDVYQSALEVIEKIKAGDIVVPANKADFDAYVASL